MSKKIVALVSVLLFILGCVGGWFLHLSMVKKDYEAAWTGYEKEVKAWQDVSERYQVLAPVCGELAGESECNDLKVAGEEAAKVVESLSLDLKKAKSASKEETQKLKKATSEIEAVRKKGVEPGVERVEKAAEVTIQDKFVPVLGEAEKKANEANGLVGSLKGKVKDENTLKALEGAAGELSSACGKWKGKDIPTGQEGVQAYLELKRLALTCNDTIAKANESHAQWQAEQKPKGAYPGAGGARPANAQPWPTRSDGYAYGLSLSKYVVCTGGNPRDGSNGIYCSNFHPDRGYPVRPANVGEDIAYYLSFENGVIKYDCPGGTRWPGETDRTNLAVGSAWYAGNYVLGRTNEGLTAWETNSGHGFFISNDGARTETF